MLEIRPPRLFRHAGELSARFASKDPRRHGFESTGVDIDLRECEFIYPPAVLWCVVYAALVRQAGAPCRLLVPEDVGVATYLKSVGLFSHLKDVGADIDDRGLGAVENSQVVLPLKRFTTAGEGEELANEALERLNSAGSIAANLRNLVAETFGELANNAAEHAESPIGAFGMIQFYDLPRRGQRFACVVADGVLGIRATLGRNAQLLPLIPYDWVAIERALRERVSGTGSPTRGIGLFGVAEDMRASGRSLIVHSGIGIMILNETVESRANRTVLFPGTLAAATITI